MPLLEELYAQNSGVATPTATNATASNAAVNTQNAQAGVAQAGSAVASNAQSPDAVASQGSTQQSTAGNVAGTTVNSTGYDATMGSVDDNQSSAYQLNQITSQNSPNMARAYRQGMLTAGRRGLQNSTIAGSAAQGEMIDRAMPLAQQDASTYATQSLTNQQYQNQADQFGANASNTASLAEAQHQADANQTNAQLSTQNSQFNAGQSNNMSALNAQMSTDVSQNNANRQAQINSLNAQLNTDVSQFNAAQLSQASALNAQMQSAISQGNAEMYNAAQQQFAQLQTQVSVSNAEQQFRASLASADMTNQVNMQVMQANTEMNRQFLAGTQAMDLAQIQGQYQQLISSNETAASMYQSYFNSISGAMANHEMSPNRIASYIGVQQSMLEASLRMIDNMNNLDLGDFTLPSAAPYGDNIQTVPGTGSIASGPAAPSNAPVPNPNINYSQPSVPDNQSYGNQQQSGPSIGYGRGFYNFANEPSEASS